MKGEFNAYRCWSVWSPDKGQVPLHLQTDVFLPQHLILMLSSDQVDQLFTSIFNEQLILSITTSIRNLLILTWGGILQSDWMMKTQYQLLYNILVQFYKSIDSHKLFKSRERASINVFQKKSLASNIYDVWNV